MIIVTGNRRSGTSMMMYALKKAGFKIVGKKFNSARKEENPLGYWEDSKICTEIGLTEDQDGEVVKVMFEALSFSKQELCEKVIVVFRDPRRMLTSMLKNNQIDYLDIFIVKIALDAIDSLVWLRNRNYIVVFYEDILSDPRGEMMRICDFLGKGDYKKAANVVDQKLNRSKPCGEYKYMELLERIYRFALKGEFQAIMAMTLEVEAISKKLINELDK